MIVQDINTSTSNSQDITKHITFKRISSQVEYQETFFVFEQAAGRYPPYSNVYTALLGDPQKHYYVGFFKERPIFSFLFHTYEQENIAFWAIYYTVPEFRGKGIVAPYFNFIYYDIIRKNYRNVYWNAALSMEDKYNKTMGSKTYGMLNIMHGRKNPFLTSKLNRKFKNNFINTDEEDDYDSFINYIVNNFNNNKSIKSNDSDNNIDNQLTILSKEDIKNEILLKYINYDKEVSGYQRYDRMKKYLELEDVNVYVSVDKENKVTGYSVMRKCKNMWLFGPVSADNDDIAVTLYHKLYDNLRNNEEFKCYIPLLNDHSKEFNNNKYSLFQTTFDLKLNGQYALQGLTPFPHNFKKYYCQNALDHSL